jgi:hypothetical protein
MTFATSKWHEIREPEHTLLMSDLFGLKSDIIYVLMFPNAE